MGSNSVVNIKKDIEKFYSLLKDHYDVRALFLYGSHAHGNPRAESDIDVAVIMKIPNNIGMIELGVAIATLAHSVNLDIEPYCIDNADFEHPEPASFVAEVKRTGIQII